MGKKVQEMLDNANQRVPKVEVNQAMEWMNDGNTVFVDVRSKDAVRDSGLVRGAVHAERGMIEFFADQEHALGKPELKPAKKGRALLRRWRPGSPRRCNPARYGV